MPIYYLKDISKELIESKLAQAGLGTIVKNSDGKNVFCPIFNLDLDHIGTYTVLEQKDNFGNTIVPFYQDLNWHTNLLLNFELTEDQKSILPIIDPEPTTKIRTFI